MTNQFHMIIPNITQAQFFKGPICLRLPYIRVADTDLIFD